MRELFGTRGCTFTADLRDDLDWQGLDYVEHDVEADAGALARMKALSGGATVPVLVEDGVVVQVGWQGRGCFVG